MSDQRLFSFTGGEAGDWNITRITTLCGEPVKPAKFLRIMHGNDANAGQAAWSFRGITSNERYVEDTEKKELVSRQEGLGKPGNDFAAMILIRKNPEWWKLSQNERRAIFEAQSKHIAIGMRYLSQIARRLHHSRDLGENEPFDFITWFEFSANNEKLFDELLSELRSTQEWNFVSREINFRISRSI